MSTALRDIVKNPFKEKLATGKVVSTLSVRVFRGVEIAIIAKSCGFDAVYVDLQHSALSMETASQICIGALGVGITPIVRVPCADPAYVSRVLDGGAMGVTVPGVNSSEEVRKVVSFSKFPPLGERSTGGGLPQLQYRNWSQAEAFEVLNETTIVLATIETLSALDHIDEIASVKGLDILMVGTNDLCAGLGVPGQHGHELVRKAYLRIIKACRENGKYVGIGGIADRKLIAEYINFGARVVSTGTDLSIMMQTGSERAQFVKSLQV
jgi:4-hydroxy-2-oxoheptanedioate aldolase